MATQAANAKIVLDALADSLGKTLTNQQILGLVEKFTNTIGGAETNEEKAALFNARLVQIIRKVARSHAESKAEADNAAVVQAAGAAAEGVL